MATNTKIVITFNDKVYDGDYAGFTRLLTTSNIVSMPERFKANRYSSGEIGMGVAADTFLDGVVAAQQYVYYFNLDHNSSGIMSISRAGKVVTIEIDPAWQFYGWGGFQPNLAGTAVATLGTSTTFSITSHSFSENPVAKCNSVLLNITTSENIDTYTINGSKVDIVSSDFSIAVPRGTKIDNIKLYQLTKVINFNTIQPYVYINKLLAGNVSVNVEPNKYKGATVTINVDYTNQLQGSPASTFEYSLDGINYVQSKVLTGQVDGDYTVYVKDNWGCIVTHDYSVTEKGNAVGFLYVSKNNSVTFSKDEVWDGKTIMKNDLNTLSESSFNKKNYKQDLLFQYNDNITIQFKSNYDLNEVILEEECQEAGFQIPVTKMSNNINRFMSLDSYMYKHKEGITGIYFDDGASYNEGGAEISQYILNGNLPDFAITGQFIDIVDNGVSLGYFEILNTVYDSSVNRRVLLVSFNYQDLPKEVITSSTYNLLDFEVYHFNINFLLYNKENYRLRIKATDSVFGEQNQYSDNIYLKDVHENTAAIEYKGEGNKDIFYAYDIKHLIRVEVESITALIEDQSTIVQGDNSTTQVDSELYDGNNFRFEAMARDRFLQCSIAVSSPILLINSEGYVKKDGIEYENIIGTNLYNLSVGLLKTGIDRGAFTSNPSVGSPIIFSPRVLTGNTGLIKL